MDENVAICGELTDAEMIAYVLNVETQDDDASSDELMEDVPKQTVPSVATNHIKELKWFFEGRKRVSDSVSRSLNLLDSFVMAEN